jgi:hypothetical protein
MRESTETFVIVQMCHARCGRGHDSGRDGLRDSVVQVRIDGKLFLFCVELGNVLDRKIATGKAFGGDLLEFQVGPEDRYRFEAGFGLCNRHVAQARELVLCDECARRLVAEARRLRMPRELRIDAGAVGTAASRGRQLHDGLRQTEVRVPLEAWLVRGEIRGRERGRIGDCASGGFWSERRLAEGERCSGNETEEDCQAHDKSLQRRKHSRNRVGRSMF